MDDTMRVEIKTALIYTRIRAAYIHMANKQAIASIETNQGD